MTKTTFQHGIALLSGIYGEIDKNKISVYFEILKGIPDDVFNSAIKNLLENHRYNNFPTIADIKFSAGDTIRQRALQGVAHMHNVAQKAGNTHNCDFGDKVLNAVANSYGWRNITYWPDEKWGYEKKGMIELYMSFSLSGRVDDQVRGYNSEIGYPTRCIKHYSAEMQIEHRP